MGTEYGSGRGRRTPEGYAFPLSFLDLSALANINPVGKVLWMRVDESVEGVHSLSYARTEYVFGHDLTGVPEAFVA